MGLFRRKKKKIVEPTYEEKLANINQQIAGYTKKQYNIRAVTAGYDRSARNVIESIKKEPNNKLLLTTAKKQLTMLFTKEALYKKYLYMIDAVKMILTIKRDELMITKGQAILDQQFMNSMADLLGKCDEGIAMVEGAASIDQLEQAFNMYTDMSGMGVGEDITDMVNQMVDQAIASAVEPQTTEQKVQNTQQEKTTEEQVDPDFVDALRKKYNL